jgi:hypothetical protein
VRPADAVWEASLVVVGYAPLPPVFRFLRLCRELWVCCMFPAWVSGPYSRYVLVLQCLHEAVGGLYGSQTHWQSLDRPCCSPRSAGEVLYRREGIGSAPGVRTTRLL